MIAIGSDHAAYHLKTHIIKYLQSKGVVLNDMGTYSDESTNYPTYGKRVAEEVAQGRAMFGIVICGTGIGISIAANKVKGIRSALCTDEYMAEMARRHNDANVLAMGARVISKLMAEKIVDTFLNTDFEGGRHEVRVNLINNIEEQYSK